MDGDLRTAGHALSDRALGQLMPMYVWLDASGVIRGMGPTMAKLTNHSAIGQSLEDVFEFRRPLSVVAIKDLTSVPRIRLCLRQKPGTGFKGVAVPLHGEEGVILNLSFGYAVRNAVRDHGLSDTDFAPTDLAIELLYLAEAKSAVMGEVTKMAGRLRGAKLKAEAQALTDVLTGLGNRRALEVAIEPMIRGRSGFAAMHLDLDFFKQVNDTLGHAAGDHVLTQVAEILRSSVRGADVVARVGGDEFVILLSGVKDHVAIRRVGTAIFEAMADPIMFEGQHCNVAISMGAILVEPQTSESAEALLSRADAALYISKRAGRARLTLLDKDENVIELAQGVIHRDHTVKAS